MKRATVLVSLTLALALALPVQAAVQIEGELKGSITYDLLKEDDPVSAKAEANTSLKFTSQAARGEINLSLNGGEGTLGKSALHTDLTPRLESAWLEVDGPYYEGLPPVTTKFGRFWEVIDPWVASFGYKDEGAAEGVRISDIALGPVEAVGFAGWFDGYHDDYRARRLAGLSVGTRLEQAELKATYVSVDGEAASSHDYAVSAAFEPAADVKVTGAYASNGANGASAVKVGAEAGLIPNVTLKGSYWSVGQGFNPAFPKRSDDDAGKGPAEFKAGGDEKGFEVGASTRQLGADLSATYRSTTNLVGGNETNSVKLAASRGFDLPVLKGFKGTLETEFNLSDPEVDPAITAKTEFSVAKIKVKTESKLHEESHTVEAEYTAPNTVKLKSKLGFKEGEQTASQFTAEYALKF